MLSQLNGVNIVPTTCQFFILLFSGYAYLIPTALIFLSLTVIQRLRRQVNSYCMKPVH